MMVQCDTPTTAPITDWLEDEEMDGDGGAGPLYTGTLPNGLQSGLRLDRALAQLWPQQLSRERAKVLIQEGYVRLDGHPITRVATRVFPGQLLQWQEPPPQPVAYPAEDLPVGIVFEDDHLLVVHKPIGMLTHPTGRTHTGTLVNALLYHCQGRLSGLNGELRPGIVHRLDKDTEGLLVVAKTDTAHRALAEQLRIKAIRREYRAIVQGQPPSHGTVDAAIARMPNHRQKMRVDAQGRWAKTHWRLVETLGGRFSWVECQLDTGRTHQIRVHMAHLGHPLVGDALYGTGLADLWGLDTGGQLLQAFRLTLTHPHTGQVLHHELPVSSRFQTAWDQLANRVAQGSGGGGGPLC